MNNPLTKNQRELLEHTLGGKKPPWNRNFFDASDGHPDLPDIRILQNLGFMREVPAPAFVSKSIWFQVTKAGKEFLKSS